MNGRRLEIHPEAEAEARVARAWYSDRSPIAGRVFLAELEHALAAVLEAPERWPADDLGLRRFLLRRYPFAVVYRVRDAAVQVIAVAHGRRRAGYWRSR